MKNMIAPFVIGGIIGIAAGALMAPAAMESEMGRKMLRKGKRAWHQMQNSVENMM